MVEHIVHLAMFDDAARIHHGHFIGQASDHRQIVRDPDERGAVLARELLHFRKNLRLDRHVERRRWLIGNDQIGPVQHCDGNRHTLAHAARELVRIGLQALLGAGNAHHAQRLARAFAGLGLADLAVRLHGFDHLRVDAQHRVQRHHRILKDHRDAVALQTAQFARLHLGEVAALKKNLATGHAAGFIDQTHDGKTGHGFARARFADEAQNAPAFDAERDIVHRFQNARAGVEFGAQIAHFQRRHRSVGRAVHFTFLGFSTSRRRSPTRLIATMVTSSAMPG